MIASAINILENPTLENISQQVGEAHKVRSFYNAIIDPDTNHNDVVVDTHAVAAALMSPMSGESTPVQHNFGASAGKSSITGVSGTYGLYADAYRDAAAARGVKPIEMQSIVWPG